MWGYVYRFSVGVYIVCVVVIITVAVNFDVLTQLCERVKIIYVGLKRGLTIQWVRNHRCKQIQEIM